MPNIVLLVGASGSGKTSLRGDLLAGLREDLPTMPLTSAVIARDDILEDWAAQSDKSYTVTFLTRADEAEVEMFRQLQMAVEKDKDIIIDQTNMSRELRAERMSYIPDHYRKICVTLEVPLLELLDRIETRRVATGKSIPDFVPVNHLGMYERPTHDEGFDEIYIIRPEDPAPQQVPQESLTPGI
ncbi:hypothetical protein LCGC14_0045600 [marine sediment metagenome]|nr:AAA family ATPase [Sulfitobacter litoralis]